MDLLISKCNSSKCNFNRDHDIYVLSDLFWSSLGWWVGDHYLQVVLYPVILMTWRLSQCFCTMPTADALAVQAANSSENLVLPS